MFPQSPNYYKRKTMVMFRLFHTVADYIVAIIYMAILTAWLIYDVIREHRRKRK